MYTSSKSFCSFTSKTDAIKLYACCFLFQLYHTASPRSPGGLYPKKGQKIPVLQILGSLQKLPQSSWFFKHHDNWGRSNWISTALSTQSLCIIANKFCHIFLHSIFCYFVNYVFSVLYIIYTELNKEWWWGGKNSKLTKHTPDHKKYWEKKLWGFEREHFLHMCNSSKERGRERKKERINHIFPLFIIEWEWCQKKNLDSLFHLGSNIILINTIL